MTPNQDENGIRYTMYSMDQIDPDVIETLLYSHGKDLSYLEACKEEEARQRSAWEDDCERRACENPNVELDDFEANLDNFDPMIDEPIIEGTYQGVFYRTSWLGGAQMFWCFRSLCVGHFELGSPCIPGACDGGSPTPRADGFCGYAVPGNWLVTDPDAPKIAWYGDFA